MDSFLLTTEQELSFPSDLNSYERRVVHEVAEERGLLHESRGEGSERRIVVERKQEAGAVQRQGKGADDRDKMVGKDSKAETTVAVGISINKSNGVGENRTPENHIRCNNCSRNVPTQNYELHQLKCAVQLLKEEESIIKDVKPKKNKKKTKKQSADTDEDFDSLCSQFQKLDKVCNFPRCKTLVATLGVDCKFCLVRWGVVPTLLLLAQVLPAPLHGRSARVWRGGQEEGQTAAEQGRGALPWLW